MSEIDTARGNPQVLKRAAELRAPLVRACSIARANGLGYALFGALTIASSIGADWPAVALGVCLAGVGVRERVNGAALLSGDPNAATSLARGELLLLSAIVIYCVVQLSFGPGDASADLELLGDAAGIDIGELMGAVRSAVYASVALISVLYQGAMSLYFHRRQPLVERYRQEAPEWARDVIAQL